MKIIKKPSSINATIVGNPTISSDFIVSDFSTNDYLTIPLNNYNVSSSSDSWEITTKIKASNISLSDQNIFNTPEDQRNFRLALNGDGSSKGFSFMVASQYGSWISLSNFRVNNIYNTADVWYFIKAGFSGSNYYVKYSTDNITWNTIISYTSSTKAQFSTYETIGKPNSNSSLSIDMKETNIKINNNIIWQGVTPEKYYAIKRPNILYQPTLNGTETITNMSGKSAPTIVNNTLTGERSATPSASGYLSEGWDNSGLWKCEFDAWYSGTETGAYLPSNTSTSRDTNLIMLTSGGGLWTYNNTTASTSSNDFPISYNTWYHVIIEKIDATSFKVTAGNTTKTYTNKATFLQNTNKICIGVDSWSNNTPPYYAVIKNIKVTNENEIKYYGIGNNIPSRYQKVDYTQSSGTQYIDTGIKANSNSLLYLKCTFNISNPIIQSTSQAGWVYGTEKHQSGGGVISGGLACSTYSSSGKMSVNFYSNSHGTIDMVNNAKNTLEINSTEIIANGISYPFTGTFQGGALDQNIYLFCLCGYGGNRYYYSSTKMYEFQFGYSKNNLVIDLVPVYDTVTQKYGMYDRISQTFKGNLGTGNFAGGND